MSRQLTIRHPLRDLFQTNKAINHLFEQAWAQENASCCRLPVNAYSTNEAIVIEAAIPGAEPEEVEITLDGDTLTIRAAVSWDESEDKNRKYLIRERGYGVLERTLTLNVPVELDGIEAEFINGVLVLTIPKAEAAKPHKISIKAAK